MTATVILHIPHSSTVVPPDVRGSLLLDDEELRLELLMMTDWDTDELFALPEDVVVTVRYPFSRLVVDPERFASDSDEPMSQVGMGAVYERTAYGRDLRRPPSPSDRARLMERFYQPHHAALERAASGLLEAHGRCIIVDCHSFPSVPLPYEPDQRQHRPDICLGTDEYHTPRELREGLVEHFTEHGMTVEIDRPYSGAIVPTHYYRRESRAQSIMIEVNRRLYMDEVAGLRLPSFDALRAVVQKAVRAVAYTAGEHL